MAKIVVGISGASGIVLGYKTILLLTQYGHYIDLVMTKDAQLTAAEELDEKLATAQKMIKSLSVQQQEKITLYQNNDFFAPIASGSYKVDAMIIVPCSMTTLAACAMGLSDTLLRRAADVTLKERRPLLLVPREAPFSEIHLENMLKLVRCGAIVIPPMPAWYVHPKSIEDVELFIVGRIFDALKLDADFAPRWTGRSAST